MGGGQRSPEYFWSEPILTAPSQSSPFDFDDFLATLKTDEYDPEVDVASPGAFNSSKFKQFFDTLPPSPNARSKLFLPSSAASLLSEKLSYDSKDDFLFMPKDCWHQWNGRHSCAAPSPKKVTEPEPEPISPVSPPPDFFDCDDITETDMHDASSRFQLIRSASVGSNRHDVNSPSTSKIHIDTKSEVPMSTGVDRERPQLKIRSPPSPPGNDWPSPPAAPSPHPSSNVATAALLQARLLAQQRSQGVFPGGQLAQIVRPPAVPVYQTGIQAGLPVQPAALLSQFVWLNVV